MVFTCASFLMPLNIIVTTLSFFGSLWMAIMSWKSRKVNNICIDFIFGIAISDFIYSICNIITIFDSRTDVDFKCYVEAVVREWSLYFSLFFAIGIAVLCSKCSSLRPFDKSDQVALLKKVIIIGSAICLFFTILPFFVGNYVNYANDNLVCHITYNKTTNPSYLEKFSVITLYEGILVSAGIIVTLKCYFYTSNFIRRLSHRSLRETTFKFMVYPFVMCLIFLPTVIDDYYRINHQCDNLWLMVIHMIMTHSIGFINAIAYGWQRIRQKKSEKRVRREERQDPGQPVKESIVLIEDEDSLKNNLREALSPSDCENFAARSTQPEG